jgi:hypothetical protein
VIVVLNVLATITLWQTAARRPEKLKKKFINALLHSQPIEPKHRQPKTIGEGWGVHDQDRKFFAEFENFAEVVNWWLLGPTEKLSWRLQERPDTLLKLDFYDSPSYGRR